MIVLVTPRTQRFGPHFDKLAKCPGVKPHPRGILIERESGCYRGVENSTAPKPRIKKAAAQGPGTELKNIFEALGVNPLGCSACTELVQRMNTWGVEGCREHKAEIIEALRSRAKDYSAATWLKAGAKALASGLAFRVNPLDPFPGVVDLAIARAEAIPSGSA